MLGLFRRLSGHACHCASAATSQVCRATSQILSELVALPLLAIESNSFAVCPSILRNLLKIIMNKPTLTRTQLQSLTSKGPRPPRQGVAGTSQELWRRLLPAHGAKEVLPLRREAHWNTPKFQIWWPAYGAKVADKAWSRLSLFKIIDNLMNWMYWISHQEIIPGTWLDSNLRVQHAPLATAQRLASQRRYLACALANKKQWDFTRLKVAKQILASNLCVASETTLLIPTSCNAKHHRAIDPFQSACECPAFWLTQNCFLHIYIYGGCLIA